MSLPSSLLLETLSSDSFKTSLLDVAILSVTVERTGRIAVRLQLFSPSQSFDFLPLLPRLLILPMIRLFLLDISKQDVLKSPNSFSIDLEPLVGDADQCHQVLFINERFDDFFILLLSIHITSRII